MAGAVLRRAGRLTMVGVVGQRLVRPPWTNAELVGREIALRRPLHPRVALGIGVVAVGRFLLLKMFRAEVLWLAAFQPLAGMEAVGCLILRVDDHHLAEVGVVAEAVKARSVRFGSSAVAH